MQNVMEKPNHSNVVRVSFDAEFYTKRAEKANDRHLYDKALRYYCLALEKDPSNVDNHLQLASLFAKLGRFEESNEYLRNIVFHLSSDYYECYYFIGHNLMSLGELEASYRYLDYYTANDPNGEYVFEATELMQLIAREIGPVSLVEDSSEEDAPYIHNMEEDPVLQCMSEGLDIKELMVTAKEIWVAFMIHESSKVVIRKPQTWAATLEYVALLNADLPTSLKQVASKYSVSPTSVSKNFHRLVNCLNQI